MFKCLTADLKEDVRQKATLAKEHKWSDIENLPKPDKHVFETWSAIPDTYMNMKSMHLESCPSLAQHAYVSKFSQA